MNIAYAADLVEGQAQTAASPPDVNAPWHRRPPPASGAGAVAKALGGQGGPGGA